MPERNEFSITGEETLLSVSEYYGVKPRSEAFDDEGAEGRAASLEGYRKVTAGDFVMNYMLAWKGAYGVSDHDGIVSPAYAVFKIDPRVADRRFIHHRLRSEHMRSVFRARSKGIIESRLRLYPDVFLSMELELPNLEIQRNIADFLDRETARIDQLIEKKQRLSTALEQSRGAMILRVFREAGAPQTNVAPEAYSVGHFGDHWSVRRIKTLVSVMTSGSRGWSDLIADEGELFLQSGDIGRRMEVQLEGAKRVEPQRGAEADRARLAARDILVCITGGRTGSVGYLENISEAAYVNQHICLLRPRPSVIQPKLLAHLLFSEIGQRQLEFFQYGLKQGLGFAQVGEVKVPVPPLSVQEQVLHNIDAQVERSERLTKRIQASLDRLVEFRAALITAAVTGQIDVATGGKQGQTDRRLDQIEEAMRA
jgi:type I restriction enzyme S subunit